MLNSTKQFAKVLEALLDCDLRLVEADCVSWQTEIVTHFKDGRVAMIWKEGRICTMEKPDNLLIKII